MHALFRTLLRLFANYARRIKYPESNKYHARDAYFNRSHVLQYQASPSSPFLRMEKYPLLFLRKKKCEKVEQIILFWRLGEKGIILLTYLQKRGQMNFSLRERERKREREKRLSFTRTRSPLS